MTEDRKENRLGNIYGGTGGNWAGMIYSIFGLCPTILTMSGGNRQPHIMEVRKIG